MTITDAWRRALSRARSLLHFREDAKHILWHAWSARLGYLLILINAFDAGFYFFIGYAPLPQWSLGLISALFGALIPYARVVVQHEISGETNANQSDPRDAAS